MEPAGTQRLSGRLPAWLAILAVAAFIAGYAIYRPLGNADLVMYIATVHHWQGESGQALHDDTYADVHAFLSDAGYADVTGAAGDPTLDRNKYLRAVEADPGVLAEQIPFYSVKPLYPGLMLALHAVGLPLGLASVVISAIAYALLVLVIFAWLSRHLRPWLAWLVTGLIGLSPPFWVLARESTPDAITLLIQVTALFVLIEWRRPWLAVALLALAILGRPNTVIFMISVVGVLALLRAGNPLRLRWPEAIVGAAVGVAIAAGLSVWSGNYGLGTLFYHAVVSYLPHPTLGAPPLAISELVRLYAFRAVQLSVSPIPFFVLLGVLAIRVRVASLTALRNDAPALLVVAALVAIAVGWLSYPNEPERILVASYLTITIVLAMSVGDRLDRGPLEPETVPVPVPA